MTVRAAAIHATLPGVTVPSEQDPALWTAFEQALAAAARSRFADADRGDADRALGEGLRAGAATWPGVVVPADVFAMEIARRLGDGAAPAALSHLRFTDVYLAIGCSRGDPAAIAGCEALAHRVIDSAGAHVRATADQTAEIRAQLHLILFVDEPGRPAALRDFTGRGDLRGYIRVIATRALIRLVNRDRKAVPVDDVTMFDALIPLGDPELALLRDRYRGDVDQAMRDAIGTLDEQARALLRYTLINGWTVDRLGQLYGVHRSTAARWVADARNLLGDRIREALAARLGMAPDDVDSIIRLVQSRVDMSIERLLGA